MDTNTELCQMYADDCANAIDMLLEFWKTDAGAAYNATMKETLIGLNEIKNEYLKAAGCSTQKPQ